MVPPAFHEDGQHTVAASAAGSRAVGDLGNGSCRVARMANRADKWDLMQQYLDLQVHPR